jgi:cell division protease FtsH
LLEDKKAVLKQGATLLLEREVITGAELKAIMDSDLNRSH